MSRIRIDRPTFRRLAGRYDLIPVVGEMLGDLETPVSAFRKLGGEGAGFLLESVEGGETWGRYSLLGAAPAGRFTARGDQVEIRWRGRRRRRTVGDPLDALARWLGRFRCAPVEGLPPFFGGAVGYVGYDAVRYVEKLPDRHAGPDDLPEIDVLLVQDLVVFDNLSHQILLVACAEPGDDPDAAYAAAVERVKTMEARLRGPAPDGRHAGKDRALRLRSGTRARDFQAAVARAQEHIRAGDCFQVVLSHELGCRLEAPALDVYRALRVINPSPYMFHLDFGARQVVGASPEVLVRVTGRRAEVRPIAGTRRRGRDAADDTALIQELLSDEKERAEHVMLVDLGRNDLGRVCEFGSVHCDELMTVERYSHVIHLVSHVRGTLREGLGCFDALRACFPAGTVSGAPKIRAMEIIDELEQRRRGVYAGAVGYFGFDGAMDTCIAIRTVVVEGGRARVGVGAGVVLDSRPRRELAETLEKAEAVRVALERAERGVDR
jgi:anthranilate synthase component 1